MIAKARPTIPPVATVAKALAALRCFVDGQEFWGVRELAEVLDMPPSTMHRMLARLRLEGFINYDKKQRKYHLGFELVRLSATVMQRHGLHAAAKPVMRELSEKTGEAVWLAQYDETEQRIAYIAESESIHASHYIAPLGRVNYLEDNAWGLAILAALTQESQKSTEKRSSQGAESNEALLKKARTCGYAVRKLNEVSAALVVAAAIVNSRGDPVGAIGLVIPEHRAKLDGEQVLGDMLREAAQRVSQRLGSRLLGGASAGSWQDAIGLINGLLQQNNPSLVITPALGGGGRNLDAVDKGLGAYGLTVASSLFDARQGRGQFGYKHKKLRVVMHMSELYFLAVCSADLNVRNAGELAKLTVSPGEEGFSGAQTLTEVLALESKENTSSGRSGAMIYLDYPEAKRQFEEGKLNALTWMTSCSNPLLKELEASTSKRSTLLTLTTEVIEALLRLNPGYRVGVVPQSAFKHWLKEDVITIAVPTVLVCREDQPEDEVYQCARAIYENRESLAQLSPAYRDLDANVVLDGLTAPVHPGSERYFKEIGIRPRYATPSVWS